MSDEPTDGEPAAHPPPGNALERRLDRQVGKEIAHGIIHAATPAAVLTKAGELASVLKGLIDQQKMFADMGGGKKHVEVGAWQACGAMLGALGGEALHAETVWTRPVMGDDGVTAQRTRYTAEVKHYEYPNRQKTHVRTTTYEVDGLGWEAFVQVKTASGAIVGSAQGMVSRSESKWAKRDDYALRSMAETRAESRAYRRAIGWIVSMAGFSPTPAEEMPDKPGKPDGPEAGEKGQKSMLRALAFMFDTGDGPNDKLAREAFAAIGERLEYIPDAVAIAIGLAASALKRHIDGADTMAPSGSEPISDAEVVPDDDDPTDTDPNQAMRDAVASTVTPDESEAATQARLANEF